MKDTDICVSVGINRITGINYRTMTSLMGVSTFGPKVLFVWENKRKQ